jgi:hypothetical protein
MQTRITTKYNIPNLDSPRYQSSNKRKHNDEGDDKDATATAKIPRAFLTLKTYDPESGVVLKFKTDRAAEVGRLIGGLGRLGRHMAALPAQADGKHRAYDHYIERPADLPQDHDVATEAQPDVSTDTPQAGRDVIASQPSEAKPQQNANTGGGGGGKKKKARPSHFLTVGHAADSLTEGQKIERQLKRTGRFRVDSRIATAMRSDISCRSLAHSFVVRK